MSPNTTPSAPNVRAAVRLGLADGIVASWDIDSPPYFVLPSPATGPDWLAVLAPRWNAVNWFLGPLNQRVPAFLRLIFRIRTTLASRPAAVSSTMHFLCGNTVFCIEFKSGAAISQNLVSFGFYGGMS